MFNINVQFSDVYVNSSADFAVNVNNTELKWCNYMKNYLDKMNVGHIARYKNFIKFN